MIFSYKELKNQGIDNYKINKKLENKELYKIEIGLYSDTEKYNQLEYVVKKYPNSIFTSESAFFYLGLTDYIPSKYFLATKHNAKKIENDKIEQIFMANHFFETGKIEMNYNNVNINIYLLSSFSLFFLHSFPLSSPLSIFIISFITYWGELLILI